tara:strand:+ start:478 stop:756 length:279 start_codon:yes stop_codon:yes gene_type:complete
MIDYSKLIYLILFFLIIFVIYFLIKRNNSFITKKIKPNSIIQLNETYYFSPRLKAIIFSIEGQKYFILESKNNPPSVFPINHSAGKTLTNDP